MCKSWNIFGTFVINLSSSAIIHTFNSNIHIFVVFIHFYEAEKPRPSHLSIIFDWTELTNYLDSILMSSISYFFLKDNVSGLFVLSRLVGFFAQAHYSTITRSLIQVRGRWGCRCTNLTCLLATGLFGPGQRGGSWRRVARWRVWKEGKAAIIQSRWREVESRPGGGNETGMLVFGVI